MGADAVGVVLWHVGALPNECQGEVPIFRRRVPWNEDSLGTILCMHIARKLPIPACALI